MLESIIIFFSLLTLIGIQASSDAINRRSKKKFWGWAKHLVTLLAIPVAATVAVTQGYEVKDILLYSAAYPILRAGFYNPIYNKVYGHGADKAQPWYYFGTTKLWDKFNKWLIEKSPIKAQQAALQAMYTVLSIPIALTFVGFWGKIEEIRNMM